MLNTIDISTSGLVAQRQRMNTIAGNIANAHSTRDGEGNISPFKRRLITFEADASTEENKHRGKGVEFKIEVDHETPFRQVHDPNHPDADENGYVTYPNVNMITEFVNALDASRAYEANIAAIEMTKQMTNLGLQILT